MKTKIAENLDRLGACRSVIKNLSNDLNGIIEQALDCCPDLKETYADIKATLDSTRMREDELSVAVRTNVLTIGESVKGQSLHAIYVNGKASWDTKALEGYAAAHPEILQFKKVGNPSVSIKEIKETKQAE